MNLRSLEQPLVDSIELTRLAKAAGVTEEQARRFLDAMADTPGDQAVRLCAIARNDRVRAANRKTRREAHG